MQCSQCHCSGSMAFCPGRLCGDDMHFPHHTNTVYPVLTKPRYKKNTAGMSQVYQATTPDMKHASKRRNDRSDTPLQEFIHHMYPGTLHFLTVGQLAGKNMQFYLLAICCMPRIGKHAPARPCMHALCVYAFHNNSNSRLSYSVCRIVRNSHSLSS